MIKIKNLVKKYGSSFTLKIDELNIDDGERVAVVGMNGSGKSTLLRIISGALKPDEGAVNISVKKKDIAYQPQEAFAFKGTVKSNVLLGAAQEKNAREIIKKCRLETLADKKISELSGGEKQRMCFARVIAGSHKLLLLDEPLSATDVETAEYLCGVLKDYCRENGTGLLMSTHLPSQALSVASKILILDNGSVAEYSDISDLKEPKSEFGKKFVASWKI